MRILKIDYIEARFEVGESFACLLLAACVFSGHSGTGN